ncbi:MAG: excinuclease ABC subunit UvrA [Phycisphaerae bacterium]
MADLAVKSIQVRGARQHNLQNVDIDLPRDRLVVITGLSGSGKSSLAFDTIYAEGRRKFVESLSAYARQFLEQLAKPEIDRIEGLPPTIAIEQHAGGSSPRSTVATTTELYDFLRLLFARVGQPHCPKCHRPVTRQTVSQMADAALALPEQSRVMLLAPLVRGRAGEHRDVFARILREGFVRVRVDGELIEAKNIPRLEPRRKHVIEAVVDRILLKPDLHARLVESIEAALRLSDGLLVVAHQPPGAAAESWSEALYSARYTCPRCDLSLPDMEPRLFSFNSPHGACETCSGLGTVLEFDPDLIIPNAKLPLDSGAIEPWRRGGQRMNGVYSKLLREFCDRADVAPATPVANLPDDVRRILLSGSTPDDAAARGWSFEGVIPNLDRRWRATESESVKQRLHAYQSERACEACHGARLRPEALAVRLGRLGIADVVAMNITAARQFFDGLRFDAERGAIAEPILSEIRQRLRFLADVGLDYLTLDRASASLSGGEAQRIRLATQVGSGLVGVCYVLDEPTIGLHQRDNDKLIASLKRLRDMGNSVLVVEHDEDVIRAADWVVDVGPGAGADGGKIVCAGTLADLLDSDESITAAYLRGDRAVEAPPRRRRANSKNALQVLNARENNLKGIDVTFPLGVFCCVTGVSGSGKSTLVTQTLLRGLQRRFGLSRARPGAHDKIAGAARIDKVIEIDQSPIGRSQRSNPATYTGLFDLIRDLYAKTREARLRGYSASRFSFNVQGGRCEACQGQGLKRIEMHFLPDVFVTCQDCKGTRYGRETLEIKYRGKSIADVLDLSAAEALPFFDSFAQVRQMLQALCDVGLGYLKLGQAASTMSGGEAQRVKLAAELGKAPVGHTLYVLDEPTSGLHFADIHKLVNVLNRLCDLGHTILVIEHNLDVIRQADWIIDLGPEGGEAGGRVVAEGTPDQVAANPDSHTGHYLHAKLRPANGRRKLRAS